MLNRLKQWARALKREVRALALAYADPRTPWYARVVVACVVAYALSPIDLIPDIIPLLGMLDDLILLPIGIVLAVRLIPPDVLAECREQARTLPAPPASRLAAAVIIALWLALAALTWLAVS
jgi:uncharacterized membrane protein YkvA (DUF1232 family)